MSARQGTGAGVHKRVHPSVPSPETSRKRSRGQETHFPEDILWRVAQSPSLSLPELALLAPTCRSFHEAYSKACAAESAWLDELTAASMSVFEPDVVDSFCKWLLGPLPQTSGQPQQDNISVRRVRDVAAGEDLSHVLTLLHSDKKIHLRVPAWKRREGSGISQLSWVGMPFEQHKMLVCADFADLPGTSRMEQSLSQLSGRLKRTCTST